MKTFTRKRFLQTSLMGGGAAWLTTSRLTASAAVVAPAGSPNGDVRVAIVGLNGKGAAHINDFRKVPGVKVAALCEVDQPILARHAEEFSKRNEKVATYVDYRKLLENDSIDAVVIATPNHWHALMAIWACQAGKDVFLEKPGSHTVWEGRQVVNAARKYNRIVQIGTQSRSATELKRAVEYVRAGKIGKIKWARALCYKLREDLGRAGGPQAVPAGLDYDLWTGPAPFVPPRRNTPKWGPVHYNWHWLWSYGGGDMVNQGIHQADICRWFLGEPGMPRSILSLGGRYGRDDDAETPNTQLAFFDYEEAPLIVEVRGLPAKPGMRAMDSYRGTRIGTVIQCEHGYFAAGVTGGGFVYDNEGNRLQASTGPGGGAHQANFIAAVRSRKESDIPAPIENGHISAAICHMANISYRTGHDTANADIRQALSGDGHATDSFERMLEHLQVHGVDVASTPNVLGPKLKIVPGTELFESASRYDAGYWANTMLRCAYRAPFVVPDKV